ncbi:LysM peptidoglycan-binding domain-containing protein, partial [Sporolactobacillus inulinus]
MKLYVVQKGDTMEEIARKHGMTIDEFRKMNTDLSEDSLQQGVKVKVAIGKQPIKRKISARSESMQASAPQPQPQAPEPAPQQTPEPAPQAVQEIKEQPNAVPNAQVSGTEDTEYPQILYPKSPEDNEWSQADSGMYPDYSAPQPSSVSPTSYGPS